MSQLSIEDRLTIIREKRDERDQLLQRVADINSEIKHETDQLADSIERENQFHSVEIQKGE